MKSVKFVLAYHPGGFLANDICVLVLEIQFFALVFYRGKVMGIVFVFNEMEQHRSLFFLYINLFPGGFPILSHFEQQFSFQQMEYFGPSVFEVTLYLISDQLVALFAVQIILFKKFPGPGPLFC